MQPVMQPVMRQKADVTQQHLQNNVETRLLRLETEINKIK